MKNLSKILEMGMKFLRVGMAAIMIAGGGNVIKSVITKDEDMMEQGVYFFIGGLGGNVIASCFYDNLRERNRRRGSYPPHY